MNQALWKGLVWESALDSKGPDLALATELVLAMDLALAMELV
jgi:hypothetical protein